MRVFIGCLICFLKVLPSIAQDLPPIQNYTVDQYQAGNQNWSITQGKQRTIYIANNKGLLVFNNHWQFYPSPNQSILRSVKAVGDVVYTGGYLDFGCWKSDDTGRLQYRSLAKKIVQSFEEDEDFWNIIAVNRWVLFQSLRRIYSYDTQTKQIKIIYAEKGISKVFEVAGMVYYQKTGEGLYRIKDGLETLVTNDKRLLNNELVNIFETPQGLLLLSQKAESFLWHQPTGRMTVDRRFAFMQSYQIYSSIQLRDGTFVLGTISNGVYHLDVQGRLLAHFNKRNGLFNNTILSLMEDVDGNLWLGLDNGITKINLQSPFRVYHDVIGILGTTYCAQLYQGDLYVGTNQGLFYIKNNDKMKAFRFVEGTKGQVWCLKKIGDTLFCGHNSGTYIIRQGKARQISDIPGTWDLKPVPDQPRLLLQGHYVGMSLLLKDKQGCWHYERQVRGFDNSVRYFEFVTPDVLLINHEYKGVYRLVLTSDFTVKSARLLSIAKGHKSSLTKFKNRVLYTFEKGIFYWDLQQNTFKKDSLLSTPFLKSPYGSGKLIPLDDKTLVAFTKNEILSFYEENIGQHWVIHKIPLSEIQRKAPIGFENLMMIDEHTCLLGNAQGLLFVDLKSLTTKQEEMAFDLFFTSVTRASPYGVKDYLSLDEEDIAIPYRQNNIRFSFTVANYEKYFKNKFQYGLKKGAESMTWSPWSEDSEVAFKNLSFGTYVFKVRAMVGNQLLSKELSYAFTISPPWYFAKWALVVFGLLLLLSLFLLHHGYRVYYKRQQHRDLANQQKSFKLKMLQNKKDLIKTKNRRLKEDIVAKNKALANSAITVLAKNNILNRIKTTLSNQQANKTAVGKVIKMIDKELDDGEHWDTFQQAFNDIDKQFLSKLKKKHPNLTPLDLRLCVYLRLNMTSKEIGPLLNISYKSVEVKRYRLRKKMGLPPRKNLVHYILDI